MVEDDDRAADLVRLLLEAEGFTVLRVANAEAALVLAPQQALSLITLDIQLPGIDGWEFLARIRESSSLAQVPVVIISGIAPQQPNADQRRRRRPAKADQPRPVEGRVLQRWVCNQRSERTHTILVVDDDPKAADVISKFLPGSALHGLTRR